MTTAPVLPPLPAAVLALLPPIIRPGWSEHAPTCPTCSTLVRQCPAWDTATPTNVKEAPRG